MWARADEWGAGTVLVLAAMMVAGCGQSESSTLAQHDRQARAEHARDLAAVQRAERRSAAAGSTLTAADRRLVAAVRRLCQAGDAAQVGRTAGVQTHDPHAAALAIASSTPRGSVLHARIVAACERALRR